MRQAPPDDAHLRHARHIGRRIRQLRLEHGMSQERLADLTGVGRLRVADWEAGRITPGAGATERIGAALDVPWWALYVPPPVELISPGAPAEQAPRPAQKHPAPL